MPIEPLPDGTIVHLATGEYLAVFNAEVSEQSGEIAYAACTRPEWIDADGASYRALHTDRGIVACLATATVHDTPNGFFVYGDRLIRARVTPRSAYTDWT